MGNSIKVHTLVIDNFTKDIRTKSTQIDIMFEQMINESERIAPFFNTKTGKLLNEKLLEYLNTKKNEFNDTHNTFIEDLVTSKQTYEDAIENIKRSVA